METTGSSQPSLRTGVLLATLILLGLLIRVAHWVPGRGYNDYRYMNHVAAMAHGERSPDSDAPIQVRPGLLAILAGWMRVFGFTTAAAASSGLLAFTLIAIFLFVITASISDHSSGLVAVFLYCFLPMDIILSTSVLPEPWMTVGALGAALVYLSATRARSLGGQLFLAFLAGVLLVVSFSIKQAAVLAGVTIAIHMLITVRAWRRLLALAGSLGVGVLVGFGAECLVFAAWTGDPLFRLNSGLVMKRLPDDLPVYTSTGRHHPRHLLAVMDSFGQFGLYYFIIVLGLMLGLSRRNRSLAFPATWCIVFALWLTFGTSNLTSYHLITKVPRYFFPILVMGCAIAGIELLAAWRHLKLKPVPTAGIVLMFVVASLWAARLQVPATKSDLTRQLALIDPEARGRLVLLTNFVHKQALELRTVASDFDQIERDVVLSSEKVLIDKLRGRGLVVSNCPQSGDSEVRERLTALRETFDTEEIYGLAWPPYFRWLGLGAQTRCVGTIYWPEDQTTGR